MKKSTKQDRKPKETPAPRKAGRPKGTRMPASGKNIPLEASLLSRLTAASIKACLPGTVICRRGIEREVGEILGDVS